ncbi:hypothetical protein [Corynebacterium mastitidis]|uniref:hypothetical protein n=1 Tax=Corynebacterium mastitidis TaxID=161890 RepID=UPI000399A1D6|nr:hypothetical protein [Corynebacterium mastitidis]
MAPDNRPTQVRRPWRSTVRSVFIGAVSLLPLLPQIADAANIDEIPAVAAVLAVTAAVSRVLTLPAVEDWLQTHLPWLAADPYQGHHRKERS